MKVTTETNDSDYYKILTTNSEEDKKILESVSEEYADDELEDVLSLASKMLMILHRHKWGIGLAAPQVGVLKRIFIMDRGENSDNIFVNPSIVDQSKWTERKEEACLSEYGEDGKPIKVIVERPKKVTIKYLTPSITDDDKIMWIAKEEHFSGKKARIVQHEIDHLDGILLSHRL